MQSIQYARNKCFAASPNNLTFDSAKVLQTCLVYTGGVLDEGRGHGSIAAVAGVRAADVTWAGSTDGVRATTNLKNVGGWDGANFLAVEWVTYVSISRWTIETLIGEMTYRRLQQRKS